MSVGYHLDNYHHCIIRDNITGQGTIVLHRLYNWVGLLIALSLGSLQLLVLKETISRSVPAQFLEVFCPKCLGLHTAVGLCLQVRGSNQGQWQ